MLYYPATIGVVADLLINLAAGWLATIVIIPVARPGLVSRNVAIVSMNLALSIFCLATAIYLRILIT